MVVREVVYPHSGGIARYPLCAVVCADCASHAAVRKKDARNRDVCKGRQSVLDLTAILTSANLNLVAEAPGVPVTDALVVAVASVVPSVEQRAWSNLVSASPDPRTGSGSPDELLGANPDPGSSLGSPVVSRVGFPGDSPSQAGPQGSSASLATLRDLTVLDRAQLTAWAADPAGIAGILAAPPAASEVAGWWAGTETGLRARLLAVAPQLVGNLEGVPYDTRDVANRTALARSIATASAQLEDGSTGRAATEQLKTRLHMLEEVRAAIQPGDSGLPRILVNFDATNGGRAVIAVGDLATSDYVSYLVPGMFYNVDSEIGSWAGAADQLVSDQAEWLARLTPSSGGDTVPTAAAVAWIGYQTPDFVSIASLELAAEGSRTLTGSLRGLEATRGDRPAPYLTVLAHSYGATAALLALERDDITVDALAMVGSPGSPAENVGQLHVRDGNVWVADAALDPVSSTGVFGSQPLAASYGAHRFGVDGAVDPITGRVLTGSVGHVDYFTAGSESFRNMALIALGQGARVLAPHGVADEGTSAARALAG